MSSAVQVALPSLDRQAERLIDLGVHEIAGLPPADLRVAAKAAASDGALLVVHPSRIRVSSLAPLLERGGKPGFVVVDMPDIDDFAPTEQATLPHSDLYVVRGIDRRDHSANWSPDEAVPAIADAGRTPPTLGDARTPALWISNGTGRDGAGQPQPTESRMVLGRQPPHLAGPRVNGRPNPL